MRQSNNKKSRDVTAFLYERLSRDDNLEGESYSIGNQKKLLTKVAKEKGYTNLVHYLDDGISGVTMDRPGFVEMIQQLEQGRAAAVFVKDLSRLGRNYIEVGRLTEEFFPEHDISYVVNINLCTIMITTKITSSVLNIDCKVFRHFIIYASIRWIFRKQFREQFGCDRSLNRNFVLILRRFSMQRCLLNFLNFFLPASNFQFITWPDKMLHKFSPPI